MVKILKKVFGLFGLNVSRKIGQSNIDNIGEVIANPANDYPDISLESKKIFEECRPYTLLGIERVDSIVTSIDYLCTNNIHGDIVECGVWRGGSIYAAVKALSLRKSFHRKIYLFDTFEVDAMFGTTNEVEADKNFLGKTVADLTAASYNKENYNYNVEEVRTLLKSTGYPEENIIFKIGRVENTLPCDDISQVALLRLDTDWYESTKHELIHLFPKVSKEGVLLIDDYGYWEGCRKAVDEYIAENNLSILLHRTDYTGRSAIKC